MNNSEETNPDVEGTAANSEIDKLPQNLTEPIRLVHSSPEDTDPINRVDHVKVCCRSDFTADERTS